MVGLPSVMQDLVHSLYLARGKKKGVKCQNNYQNAQSEKDSKPVYFLACSAEHKLPNPRICNEENAQMLRR